MCIIFKMDDKRQRIHRESVVVRYRRSTIIHIIIIIIIWLFINSLNTNLYIFLVSVLTPSRVYIYLQNNHCIDVTMNVYFYFSVFLSYHKIKSRLQQSIKMDGQMYVQKFRKLFYFNNMQIPWADYWSHCYFV